MPLSGASNSAVLRVGDTLRRPGGARTPAVQALLRHLDSYVERQAGFLGYRFDDLLVDGGRLIRRYHDARAGFVAPDGTRWRVQVGAPAPAEGALRPGVVVCHNDLAPYSTSLVAGRPACLISGTSPRRGRAPGTWRMRSPTLRAAVRRRVVEDLRRPR